MTGMTEGMRMLETTITILSNGLYIMTAYWAICSLVGVILIGKDW